MSHTSGGLGLTAIAIHALQLVQVIALSTSSLQKHVQQLNVSTNSRMDLTLYEPMTHVRYGCTLFFHNPLPTNDGIFRHGLP